MPEKNIDFKPLFESLQEIGSIFENGQNKSITVLREEVDHSSSSIMQFLKNVSTRATKVIDTNRVPYIRRDYLNKLRKELQYVTVTDEFMLKSYPNINMPPNFKPTSPILIDHIINEVKKCAHFCKPIDIQTVSNAGLAMMLKELTNVNLQTVTREEFRYQFQVHVFGGVTKIEVIPQPDVILRLVNKIPDNIHYIDTFLLSRHITQLYNTLPKVQNELYKYAEQKPEIKTFIPGYMNAIEKSVRDMIFVYKTMKDTLMDLNDEYYKVLKQIVIINQRREKGSMNKFTSMNILDESINTFNSDMDTLIESVSNCAIAANNVDLGICDQEVLTEGIAEMKSKVKAMLDNMRENRNRHKEAVAKKKERTKANAELIKNIKKVDVPADLKVKMHSMTNNTLRVNLPSKTPSFVYKILLTMGKNEANLNKGYSDKADVYIENALSVQMQFYNPAFNGRIKTSNEFMDMLRQIYLGEVITTKPNIKVIINNLKTIPKIMEYIEVNLLGTEVINDSKLVKELEDLISNDESRITARKYLEVLKTTSANSMRAAQTMADILETISDESAKIIKLVVEKTKSVNEAAGDDETDDDTKKDDSKSDNDSKKDDDTADKDEKNEPKPDSDKKNDEQADDSNKKDDSKTDKGDKKDDDTLPADDEEKDKTDKKDDNKDKSLDESAEVPEDKEGTETVVFDANSCSDENDEEEIPDNNEYIKPIDECINDFDDDVKAEYKSLLESVQSIVPETYDENQFNRAMALIESHENMVAAGAKIKPLIESVEPTMFDNNIMSLLEAVSNTDITNKDTKKDYKGKIKAFNDKLKSIKDAYYSTSVDKRGKLVPTLLRRLTLLVLAFVVGINIALFNPMPVVIALVIGMIDNTISNIHDRKHIDKIIKSLEKSIELVHNKIDATNDPSVKKELTKYLKGLQVSLKKVQEKKPAAEIDNTKDDIKKDIKKTMRESVEDDTVVVGDENYVADTGADAANIKKDPDPTQEPPSGENTEEPIVDPVNEDAEDDIVVNPDTIIDTVPSDMPPIDATTPPDVTPDNTNTEVPPIDNVTTPPDVTPNNTEAPPVVPDQQEPANVIQEDEVVPAAEPDQLGTNAIDLSTSELPSHGEDLSEVEPASTEEVLTQMNESVAEVIALIENTSFDNDEDILLIESSSAGDDNTEKKGKITGAISGLKDKFKGMMNAHAAKMSTYREAMKANADVAEEYTTSKAKMVPVSIHEGANQLYKPSLINDFPSLWRKEMKSPKKLNKAANTMVGTFKENTAGRLLAITADCMNLQNNSDDNVSASEFKKCMFEKYLGGIKEITPTESIVLKNLKTCAKVLYELDNYYLKDVVSQYNELINMATEISKQEGSSAEVKSYLSAVNTYMKNIIASYKYFYTITKTISDDCKKACKSAMAATPKAESDK